MKYHKLKGNMRCEKGVTVFCKLEGVTIWLGDVVIEEMLSDGTESA